MWHILPDTFSLLSQCQISDRLTASFIFFWMKREQAWGEQYHSRVFSKIFIHSM